MCGKLGFGGAPAGAEGRFFKEKAPQKPFWEKVFGVPHGGVRTWRFPRLRGRAQYLPRAKTVSGGRFFFGAHFSLGEKKVESIKFPLFRRGGFHIRPSANFDLSVSFDS